MFQIQFEFGFVFKKSLSLGSAKFSVSGQVREGVGVAAAISLLTCVGVGRLAEDERPIGPTLGQLKATVVGQQQLIDGQHERVALPNPRNLRDGHLGIVAGDR